MFHVCSSYLYTLSWSSYDSSNFAKYLKHWIPSKWKKSTDFKVFLFFKFWGVQIFSFSNLCLLHIFYPPVTFFNHLLHSLNVCYIWCIRCPKKIKEDKIWSWQNLTLCYKWQIQTCSLSKCQLNMLSCRCSHWHLKNLLLNCIVYSQYDRYDSCRLLTLTLVEGKTNK